MSDGSAVLLVDALDTRGEEGIVPEVSAIAELGAGSACVVTAFVGRTPAGPAAVHPVPMDLLERQLASALEAAAPAVACVGLVSGAAQAQRLAERLASPLGGRIVLAPVARLGGAALLDDAARDALVRALFPLARVVVVRAADLATFGAPAAEDAGAAREAAARLRGSGARAALVAGVTVRGRIVDLLDDSGHVSLFDAARVLAPRVAGLGGAHAAALAAHLARGADLARAAEAAQRYVALRLQRRR